MYKLNVIVEFKVVCNAHQTYKGWKNWMTITNPSVTRIIPKFNSSMRQHIPLMLGQKGFGAAIVSTVTPPFLDVFVLAVLATDGATPLRYE